MSNTPKWMRQAEHDAAVADLANAAELWARVQEGFRAGREDTAAVKALYALVKPGLYEHFKSDENDPKFYGVEGVHLNIDGKTEPVVTYFALYQPHENEWPSRKLLNPKDAFWGPINRPNDPKNPWVGRRFRLMQPLSHEELGRLKDRAELIAKEKTRAEVLRSVEVVVRS